MPAHQPGFTTYPPPSADSTSSTSFPVQSDQSDQLANSDSEATAANQQISDSDSEADSDTSRVDSLADASPADVENVALGFLGFQDGQALDTDKPDIWDSHIFNRPAPGSENDKEVTKAAFPILMSYLETLDATDWMYPTPACFRPHHAGQSANEAFDVDLPAFNGRLDWMDQALNLNEVDPLLHLPHAEDIVDQVDAMGEKEAELEMSFVERSSSGKLGLSHGLLNDVALLGV